jgi:multidrug transporter EmrE-like cation transporter
MKVFQENFETSDKPWFLFWIFFFSFLITLTLAIKKRKKNENRTIILGLIMGIPNIFSSFFLIESLKTFNAVLVYPVVNISIIVLTALIVKIFWKEIWNIYSITALISGILSIILLSL